MKKIHIMTRLPIMVFILSLSFSVCFAPLGTAFGMSVFEVIRGQLDNDKEAGTQPSSARDNRDNSAINLDASSPPLPKNGVVILSPDDKKLYRDIFRLQENGQLDKADKKIQQLENKLLLGHVLYQRYMHPTAYRSSYRELRAWLTHYADHPKADKIYIMARKRGTSQGLVRPKIPHIPSFLLEDDAEHLTPAAEVKRRARWRHHEYKVYRKIVQHIRKERPSYAYKYLGQEQDRMSKRAQALSLVHIAKGYFLYGGLDDRVLAVAQHGLALDEAGAPDLHWWAGIAAWRMGDYLRAAHHFRTLTFSENVSPEMATRSAVWAARALMKKGFADEVNELLEHAVHYPFSFYGQLASEMLGQSVSYQWDWYGEKHSIDGADGSYFFSYPAARRALALFELGDVVRSSREFRAIIRQLPASVAVRYIQYIGEGDLASLALAVGRNLNKRGIRVNFALYPVPDWQPEDGFRLEPALIFGFIRQESTFKPNALSRDGASGLMQLMPATAKFISRNKRVQRDKLFKPEYNMSLGQRYIESLMRESYIRYNLLFTAVSYNGGPGNFLRWKKRMDYRDDPLLFLEAIPSYETRHFTSAVMLNYWIYADRLGKPALSRRHLAEGAWPIYGDRLKELPVKAVAKNIQNY